MIPVYFNQPLSKCLLYKYGCNVIFVSPVFYDTFIKPKHKTESFLTKLINELNNNPETNYIRLLYENEEDSYVIEPFVRDTKFLDKVNFVVNNWGPNAINYHN